MARVDRCSFVALAALASFVTLPAGAIVIPVTRVALFGYGVPANGVFLFAEIAGPLEVVVTLDDEPIEGSLERVTPYYAVWRPAAPLLVGGIHRLSSAQLIGGFGAIDVEASLPTCRSPTSSTFR